MNLKEKKNYLRHLGTSNQHILLCMYVYLFQSRIYDCLCECMRRAFIGWLYEYCSNELRLFLMSELSAVMWFYVFYKYVVKTIEIIAPINMPVIVKIKSVWVSTRTVLPYFKDSVYFFGEVEINFDKFKFGKLLHSILLFAL